MPAWLLLLVREIGKDQNLPLQPGRSGEYAVGLWSAAVTFARDLGSDFSLPKLREHLGELETRVK